jgi:hypothetical protein
MNNTYRKTLLGAAFAIAACASTTAGAAPIRWTDWTSGASANGTFNAQGTIKTDTATIDVGYTNPQGVAFIQTNGGTDYWDGGNAATSPYTSTAVDNRPTGTDIIGLQYAGSQTLTFSQAIANPVFAFVSLNGNGYAFDRDFDVLSVAGVDGNACGHWGCGGVTKQVVTVNGATLYQLIATGIGGNEPHGALQFKGTFASVTWQSLSNEMWNGFTVGVQGTAAEVFPGEVPEPAAPAVFAIGMSALLLARKRRSRG